MASNTSPGAGVNQRVTFAPERKTLVIDATALLRNLPNALRMQIS
jgi:hypothetical protein